MANAGKKYESPYISLKKRIRDRRAGVSVMGMGRIGLPLAVNIASAGFRVEGIDPDKRIANRIRRGEGAGDVPNNMLCSLLKSGKLIVSTNPSSLKRTEVILVCVPTPLRERKELDLTYVKSATLTARKFLKKPSLIILESTTYPGTTEELAKRILEQGGLRAGKDFFLAYGPERLDPGNSAFNIGNTTKLVGGVTGKCASLARDFYRTFIEKVRLVSSPKVAEMAKIFENVFRSVNIALVNEFAQICSRMDMDAYEVLDSAATKEFGFMPFKPGPGVGGHCIPLDPYYFLWKSREFDIHARFIQLALEINENMPYYVVDKLSGTLNARKKCLNGSNILLLGITYKAGVADVRESPAMKIYELLEQRGAKVRYHDKMCGRVNVCGKTARSTPLTPSMLRKTDAVIITTAHESVNYDMVLKNSPLILDTRYVLKGRQLPIDKVVWL